MKVKLFPVSHRKNTYMHDTRINLALSIEKRKARALHYSFFPYRSYSNF